ncbi:MAG TPA: hypothetical protein VG916_12990 [Gemmatimonadaceae bacterium]|nr:hypothetical protein [Gemmatimonadaceae bacterium]
MRTTTSSALLATLAFAAACSSGSPTNPSGTTAETTYTGVFATGSQSGSFVISTASTAADVWAGSASGVAAASGTTRSAHGTITILGGSATQVNGTFNPATGAFALAGGVFSLAVTVDATAQVSGTITVSGAAGVASGVASTSTVSVTRYCGTFTGSNSGRLNLTIAGTTITGVAVGNGDGGGTVLNGTVSGTTATIHWIPDPGQLGTATGTITSSGITNGVWTSEQESGTWSATAGC